MYVQDSLNLSETAVIEIGSYVGEMTNELPHDVNEDFFWSAGPKFWNISGQKRPTVKS